MNAKTQEALEATARYVGQHPWSDAIYATIASHNELERVNAKLRSALLRTHGSLGLIIKGAKPDASGHKENYDHAMKVLDETC